MLMHGPPIGARCIAGLRYQAKARNESRLCTIARITPRGHGNADSSELVALEISAAMATS
jgi:hypothetical protein